MIVLLQRVSKARVLVDGAVVGEIGAGLLVLLGIHITDTEVEAEWLARKTAALRVFQDHEGKMNRSLIDTGGEALVVSQFTLYGDARRGNRPSFIESAPPEIAEPLYEKFAARLASEIGQSVDTGVFGAMMSIELVNDGPVTLWLERRSNA